MCRETRDTTNGEWAKVRKNDLGPAREDEMRTRSGRDQVTRGLVEVLVGRSQEKRHFIFRQHLFREVLTICKFVPNLFHVPREG